MQKRNKINIKPRYLFVLMVSLCAVILIVSFRSGNNDSAIRQFAGDVVTPMQSGINKLGSFFADKLKYFKSIDDLTAENASLKEQLADISYQNKVLMQSRYELDDLKKLYNLDNNYADYPKVAARVIYNNSSNWYSSFGIDKGTDDGIKVGMNVMAGDCLVGIVTKTGHNNATVKSIIDDSSNVSGMFLDTSDTCIVKGNLKTLENGHIEVTDIKKGADIKDGYEVVTSYISTKYHPGILIGYISDITVDSSNMTESAKLTPAVDFSKLDMVLIITKEKEAMY